MTVSRVKRQAHSFPRVCAASVAVQDTAGPPAGGVTETPCCLRGGSAGCGLLRGVQRGLRPGEGAVHIVLAETHRAPHRPRPCCASVTSAERHSVRAFVQSASDTDFGVWGSAGTGATWAELHCSTYVVEQQIAREMERLTSFKGVSNVHPIAPFLVHTVILEE